MELKFSKNCAYMIQNMQLTYFTSISVFFLVSFCFFNFLVFVCLLFPLVFVVYFPLFCGSKTSNHNMLNIVSYLFFFFTLLYFTLENLSRKIPIIFVVFLFVCLFFQKSEVVFYLFEFSLIYVFVAVQNI